MQKGRFIINSQYTSFVQLERTLPISGDFSELGSVTTTSGKHGLFFGIKVDAGDTGFSSQYSIATTPEMPYTTWTQVTPLFDGGSPSLSIALDLKLETNSIRFRIRRVSGANSAVVSVNVQNLKTEDSVFLESSVTGQTDAPSESIDSIPFGNMAVDHKRLINIGTKTHDQIDVHIDASAPHAGHESLTNKGEPNGYAGLDANGKVPSTNLNIGDQAGSVCAGDDARLAQIGQGGIHASTHRSTGNDPLNLEQLSGNLDQSRSHSSTDVDSSTTAIHHTLGLGANQAAQGNHQHVTYAPSNKGVTNGDYHDHYEGDGAQIDHQTLSNKGTNDHAAIDSHISSGAPHSGHESTGNRNAPSGYAGLRADSKIDIQYIPTGTDAASVCVGDDIRLTGTRTPSAHATSHSSGQSDALSVANLSGNLIQSRSHQAADTDVSATSLHHTLGTGQFQSAAGNHTHAYAPSANGVTNGNAHDHNGGDGAQVDHANLSGIGTSSHADIDTHLEAEAPHSGHESIGNKGQPNGYAGLSASSKVPGTNILYGNSSSTACEGNDPRLTDTRPTGPHTFATVDSLGEQHTLAGATAGQVLKATSATAARMMQLDHTELSSIGTNAHSAIDSHIASAAPHSGHAPNSHATNANTYGYGDSNNAGHLRVGAGLSVLDGTVEVEYGTSSGTACEGADSRLSDPRTPVIHAASHQSGETDELVLSLLDGNLDQSRTHENPDTDDSALSLHHTLGTSATQAAQGDHTHPHLPLAGGTLTGALVLASDASQAMHPVTLQQFETAIDGMSLKLEVRLATTGDLASLSGLPIIDTKQVVAGNRIGVIHQANPIQNGVYIADASTWTRATDFDGNPNGEVRSGSYFYVQDGDVNKTTKWAVYGPGVVSVGVDPINFTQYAGAGAYTAGAGLTVNGTVFSVTAGTYAPSANGVTNGDSHDHNGGDGAQIAHSSLSGIGSNAHSAIDTHLGASAPHAGHALSANGVTNGDSHDHNGGDGGQIAHSSLSGIGSNAHSTIDTHLGAAAPHSGHAATSHPHVGGDITSIVGSATVANRVRTSEPGSYTDGDIWMV